MRYLTLVLLLISSLSLNAQDCVSVKKQLLHIAKLKVEYERASDYGKNKHVYGYHDRMLGGYKHDLDKIKAQYLNHIAKLKSDKSIRKCIEVLIAQNDSASNSYKNGVEYRYVNPLLSTVLRGSYLTYLDYLKAVHYSIYVADEDRLLLPQKIPALSYLFNDHAPYKY